MTSPNSKKKKTPEGAPRGRRYCISLKQLVR
nr:MAG TPA: hypothetical protein [Caudoviricetes sp.]